MGPLQVLPLLGHVFSYEYDYSFVINKTWLQFVDLLIRNEYKQLW